MDPETRTSIISTHAHLIASPPVSSTASSASASAANKSGNTTIDDSGPPSPASGVVKNFGVVAPGVYRSSFPYETNFAHLRGLGLRTILTLVGAKNETEEFRAFVKEEGIRHLRIPVPAHKSTNVVIPVEVIGAVLGVLEDPRNHPVLVHCNKGKHRTGCMIAAYRALHAWPLESILAEYKRYAAEKVRALDEAFIRRFDSKAMRGVVDDAKALGREMEGVGVGLPTPPGSEKEGDYGCVGDGKEEMEGDRGEEGLWLNTC